MMLFNFSSTLQSSNQFDRVLGHFQTGYGYTTGIGCLPGHTGFLHLEYFDGFRSRRACLHLRIRPLHHWQPTCGHRRHYFVLSGRRQSDVTFFTPRRLLLHICNRKFLHIRDTATVEVFNSMINQSVLRGRYRPDHRCNRLNRTW